MELTKQQAYDECNKRMKYAASMIRAAALSTGFGYSYAINSSVEPHGGWAQEHLYWLYCMDFINATADNIPFRIEDNFLHVNTGSGFKKVYAHD